MSTRRRWLEVVAVALGILAIADGALFLFLEEAPCALRSLALLRNGCARGLDPITLGLSRALGVDLLIAGGFATVFHRPLAHATDSAMTVVGEGWRGARRSWAGLDPWGRGVAVGLALVTVSLRSAYLAQPIRYDEASTYLVFARMPWFGTISDYRLPNNHILHSLLVNIGTGVLGDATWAIRLPAFLAGLLLVPATFALARSVYGSRVAWPAAALVAVSSPLVLYSTNARGYSMLALFAVLLALCAARLASRWEAGDALSFVILGAAGLYTVPTFALPFAGVSAWLLVRSLGDARMALRVTALAAGVIASAAWLYAPVLANTGLASLSSNRFVEGTEALRVGLVQHARDVWAQWTLGLPGPLVPVLLVGMVLGVASMCRSRERALVPLLLGVALAYALGGGEPQTRVWLYLLPFLLIAAGGAVADLAAFATARWPRMGGRAPDPRAVCLGAAVALGAWVVGTRSVLADPDGGVLPDAREIAVALRPHAAPEAALVTMLPSDSPVRYHLARDGAFFPTGEVARFTARTLFVVVNRRYDQTLQRVLEENGMRLLDRSPEGLLLLEMGNYPAPEGSVAAAEFEAPVLEGTFPQAWLIRLTRRSGVMILDPADFSGDAVDDPVGGEVIPPPPGDR